MTHSWRRGEYEVSTDPKRIDLHVAGELLKRSYWAAERPASVIERSFRNSLVFGLYRGSRLAGVARVVTDRATFAWLCDVYIDEQDRGQGLSKWLMEVILSHPDVQGLRRWLLATKDAHGLYRQYGFQELLEPERWMERRGEKALEGPPRTGC